MRETEKYQNGYGNVVSVDGDFSHVVSCNVVEFVEPFTCTACCRTRRGLTLLTDDFPMGKNEFKSDFQRNIRLLRVF